MQICATRLRDVKLIRLQKYSDDRGWFSEAFNAKDFASAGISAPFVQDNQSFSRLGVLRGLHYQLDQPQGKLVRVLSGHIWDVAVDLRPDSPEFGQWIGVPLHADNLECLWIPEGYAHGFLVLSETASVFYKTTRFYDPGGERCIRWDDPTLAIAWPLHEISAPLVSVKDAAGTFFKDADLPAPSTSR